MNCAFVHKFESKSCINISFSCWNTHLLNFSQIFKFLLQISKSAWTILSSICPSNLHISILMAKTKHNIKVHSSFHSINNMVNGIYEIIFGVHIFCGFMQRLFVSGSDSGVSGHVRKCFDTYNETYLYLLGNIFVLLRIYFCSEAFWGFGLRLFVSESTSGVSGFVKKCFCIYREIYLYLQGNVSVFVRKYFWTSK